MPKKSLKSPTWMAPGARRDFFSHIQDLVLRCGDVSTAELAARTGYSAQSMYVALTGPRVPSRRVTEAIVTALGQPADEMLSLWVEAVGEQRDLEEVQQTILQVRAAACNTVPDPAPRPVLTPREQEVLSAWLKAETNDPVLQNFGFGVGALNGHLRSIRAKYRAAGRPASTKTMMLVRAMQDGLLSLRDFD